MHYDTNLRWRLLRLGVALVLRPGLLGGLIALWGRRRLAIGVAIGGFRALLMLLLLLGLLAVGLRLGLVPGFLGWLAIGRAIVAIGWHLLLLRSLGRWGCRLQHWVRGVLHLCRTVSQMTDGAEASRLRAGVQSSTGNRTAGCCKHLDKGVIIGGGRGACASALRWPWGCHARDACSDKATASGRSSQDRCAGA